MPKKVEEIYQKKDLHQHILDRPNSYIGSTKLTTEERYIIEDNNKVSKKVVEYNPGLIKIFDEILVNAIDHTVREKTANIIKVNIDSKTGEISVYNNGPGVPVVIHKEYQIYVPELVFGNLLTSSNYDDTAKRIVGGQNGLGANCANIFSKKFIVETVDENTGLYYYQEFTNNMFDKTEPIIKKSKVNPYTKITFLPDYSKFKMKKLSKDAESLMKCRVYDTTACTDKKVSVYLNDTKLLQKDFLSYMSLYTDEKIINEVFNENNLNWEVGVFFTEKPDQVSFVNGINTYNGGKHVEHVINQIVKKLTNTIQTKKKITDIKPSYIKERLFVFVKATVVNPTFTSQSKEYLTTNVKDFNIKIDFSDKFIDKLYKSGITDDLLSFVKYKNEKALAKNVQNTSRKTKLNIPKLIDANYAGTSKSSKCTLILTEGDSAKTFAVSGLSIVGRDYYAVFPLKGKVLNVREATQNQLLNNEEVNNLKKIIGLQHGKKYESLDGLRYGKVMLLTDADTDGTHVSGLIMNFFHNWWPELLEIPGFLINMRTPILKVSKGKEILEFYSQNDYIKWKENLGESIVKKYTIKYYKGLGTSTANEAKDIFKKMDKNLVQYISNNEKLTKKAILLAFEKKQADNRKLWLQKYKIEEVDYSSNEVTYDDFINKYLVQFSLGDIARSIPSIYDGLKPSQRKVLYTMFKKNYTKEIKVAQFAGAVGELTAYHHGEASLYSTIVNMAQDYPGSNNINLLKPNGQFGCLDPETKVLMYNGGIKKAKDVEIGDLLIGDDSFPRKVLQLTQGVDDMFKVTLENGEWFKVNSQHILTFKVKCHKMLKYNPLKLEWIFTYFDKDLLNMCKIIFKDSIFNEPSLEIRKRRNIAYDYINKIFHNISSNDIFDIRLQDYLSIDDFTKSFMFALKNNEPLYFNNKYYLKDPEEGYNFGLHLKNDIFIPNKYKFSRLDSRLAIIKGVISQENIEVFNYEQQMVINLENFHSNLIKDLNFIIKSLGIYSFIKNKYLHIKGKKIYKLFKYSYAENLKYFIMPKKTYKIKITYEGTGNFNGWELNGNHRFLLSNFILTHNSRLQNGKDAASPRYIFTEINEITKKIFNPLDFPILKYLNDDGFFIEPENYIPIIPIVLANGCQGIGTGFSTYIPPYNPQEIIENMERKLQGKKYKPMSPYFKNYKGKIIKSETNDKSYDLLGNYEKINEITLKITEIPVAISIEEYLTFIKGLTEEKHFINNYNDNSTDNQVNVSITFNDAKTLNSFLKTPQMLYKNLKLSKSLSINNMHLFNKEGKIKKYEDIYQILDEFIEIRLIFNQKRKDYLINSYNNTLSILNNKIRFIKEIIDGSLVVYKRKKDEIIKDLTKLKYDKIEDSYDYLLSMSVYSFTFEKIKELKDKINKNNNLLDEIKNKTKENLLVEDLTNLKSII